MYSQIETLACHGMDDVGGVPDESHPVRNVLIGLEVVQSEPQSRILHAQNHREIDKLFLCLDLLFLLLVLLKTLVQ